jgi:hydrogenase maturation protease
MGDDGIGPYVARVIPALYHLPNGVTVLDLGTPGLDLSPYIGGLDLLVVVDSVKEDARPGEVRTYSRDEILRHAPGPRTNPHEPGLKEALLTAEFAGHAPRDVVLVGVVPAHVGTGTHLSPEVRGAIPRAVAEVVAQFVWHGFRLRRRRLPTIPDIWWERAPESQPAA